MPIDTGYWICQGITFVNSVYFTIEREEEN